MADATADTRYKILVPLDEHEGAVTGRPWTCSRGRKITAPEGEFDALEEGEEYRVLGKAGEDATNESTTPTTTDTDS